MANIRYYRVKFLSQLPATSAQDGDLYFVRENAHLYIWDSEAHAMVSVTGGGAVTSVFGRAGIVVAQPGDYSSVHELVLGDGQASIQFLTAENGGTLVTDANGIDLESGSDVFINAATGQVELSAKNGAGGFLDLGSVGDFTMASGTLTGSVKLTTDDKLHIIAGAAGLVIVDPTGVLVGQATGGPQGNGTLNAIRLYQNGAQVAADADLTSEVSRATAAETTLQTNINACEKTANKGANNGYAPLDSSAKVPLANLPSSIQGGMNYQGVWNATTNTPTLASGVGTKGFFYKVSVAGSTSIDGISQWNVGDSIVFDGTTWDKIDGIANEVVSVAGKTGAVTLVEADIASLTTDLASKQSTLTGTGLARQSGACTELSGDVTTSGSNATTLKNTGTSGTYTKVTTDAQGRVSSGTTLAAGDIPNIAESQVTNLTTDLASKQSTLTGTGLARNSGACTELSGDVTTSGSNATTLKNTGTAGTYTKVTTDAQGRVSSGTTLTPSDLPVISAGAAGFWGGTVYPELNTDSTTVILSSNNEVRALQFVLPFSVTVDHLSFSIGVGQANAKVDFGIYDSTGTTLLATTGGVSATTAQNGTNRVALSQSVTLRAGVVYYFAWTCNNSAVTFQNTLVSAAMANVLNAGSVRMGTSGTASTGGALGASLGTLSAIAARTPLVFFD